jgi:hypothetical protein
LEYGRLKRDYHGLNRSFLLPYTGLPVLGYYLYWYIGLVMEENELHKDNTDER